MGTLLFLSFLFTVRYPWLIGFIAGAALAALVIAVEVLDRRRRGP